MNSTALSPISDAARARRSHRQAGAFTGLLAVGVALSLVFGFHAVLNRPVLVVSHPVTQRQGLVTVATVVVRNRSSRVSYCPTVSVSALDSSGTALETEPAVPLQGSGRVEPSGSVSFRATFRGLTAADYRDKVDKWEGFVLRSGRCG
jgi:hypothetical protein